MTDRSECDHLLETVSEVLGADDVADSLDNGGEPGEDVAGKMSRGVELSSGVNQKDQIGGDVTDEVADEDKTNRDVETVLLISLTDTVLMLQSLVVN